MSSFKPPFRRNSSSEPVRRAAVHSDHSNKQERPSSLDVQFVDYDGVRFHLSTPESKTTLLLSMQIRCWDELVRYGAVEVLKREYGALVIAQPESEYNVSLEVDLNAAPPDDGE